MPALDELVDKIVYTYKFTTLPNIDLLRQDCKVWLVTILDKFDSSKGSKAFSYFSVITKNWFIHKIKKNAKAARREVDINGIPSPRDVNNLSVFNPYHKSRERAEFWKELNNFVVLLHDNPHVIKNENDKKVLLAVKSIIEAPEELEILNKKAIYLYLRELNGP